jgi:hypothetical protein
VSEGQICPGYHQFLLFKLKRSWHACRHDALAIHKDYAAVAKTRGIEVRVAVTFAGPACRPLHLCSHTLQSEPARLNAVLESMVLYLVLSPWDNEVSDTLHRLKTDARLETVPAFRALVQQLTTNEVVQWPLPGPLGDAVRAHGAFTLPPPAGPAAGADVGRVAAAAASAARSSSGASGSLAASLVVRKEDEERSGWSAILHKRILQHNLRVIAKWYQRVRTRSHICRWALF